MGVSLACLLPASVQRGHLKKELSLLQAKECFSPIARTPQAACRRSPPIGEVRSHRCFARLSHTWRETTSPCPYGQRPLAESGRLLPAPRSVCGEDQSKHAGTPVSSRCAICVSRIFARLPLNQVSETLDNSPNKGQDVARRRPCQTRSSSVQK